MIPYQTILHISPSSKGKKSEFFHTALKISGFVHWTRLIKKKMGAQIFLLSSQNKKYCLKSFFPELFLSSLQSSISGFFIYDLCIYKQESCYIYISISYIRTFSTGWPRERVIQHEI